jgi:hypothetical protein
MCNSVEVLEDKEIRKELEYFRHWISAHKDNTDEVSDGNEKCFIGNWN